MYRRTGSIMNFQRNDRPQPTTAESRLWSVLESRDTGELSFYRRRPIGRYVAEVFCPEARLAISTAGGDALTAEDRQQDAMMETIGIKVLRFRAADVESRTSEVVDRVLEAATARLREAPEAQREAG